MTVERFTNPAAQPTDAQVSVLLLALHVREVTVYCDNFCRSFANRNRITVCSYFKPEFQLPPSIRVIGGDGTVRGFLQSLETALSSGEIDLIHSHYPHVSLMLLLKQLLIRGRKLPPSLQTVHNDYKNYRLRNRLMWPIVYPFIDYVNHCSRASLESFPKWMRATSRNEPVAIPNAVDIDFIDRAIAATHRTFAESSSPGFHIAYVGRLIPCKNVETLIRAFSQCAVSGMKLTIIGEGSSKPAMERLIHLLGIDSMVTLTGRLPLEEVYRTLAEVDLVVHSSRAEGLPRSPLEAMACRAPVLLSDIPPHREVAGDCDWIPLVGCDDEEGFATEIDRFRQMPGPERKEIGHACRRLVEEKFSIGVMHDRYETLYHRILADQIAKQNQSRSTRKDSRNSSSLSIGKSAA